MDESGFPPPLRLALAYAPASALPAWRALLALDARLAGFMRGAREPMLAQIRLAWWRERLNEAPALWPQGDPVLTAIADWGEALPGLSRLVDGWEALLAVAPLPEAAIADFAGGRAAAMEALARRLGCGGADGLAHAARLWTLVDLAGHLGDAGERQAAIGAARAIAGRSGRLPRAMRPLAVLAALAAGDIAGMSRGRQLARAIRVGIVGI